MNLNKVYKNKNTKYIYMNRVYRFNKIKNVLPYKVFPITNWKGYNKLNNNNKQNHKENSKKEQKASN